jgi:predicted 3-demethylubiquinone-9 3-methyltransferase (glyoxalase superfamily)
MPRGHQNGKKLLHIEILKFKWCKDKFGVLLNICKNIVQVVAHKKAID